MQDENCERNVKFNRRDRERASSAMKVRHWETATLRQLGQRILQFVP